MLALLATGLLGLSAFAAAVAGLLALGLSIERHWQDACGALRHPGMRTAVQGLGLLSLLASLGCCAGLRAQGLGFVPWIGCVTAAAWVAIGLLSHGAATAARVVRLSGVLAALGCVMAMVLRFG